VATLVSTLTSHLKLLGVGIGAIALFGGTATTISLADSSTPTPTTHPAPQADPHATAPKKSADAEDADDADEAKESKDSEDTNERSGVRPTDTHGYCVSHAVAAAKAHGAKGKDIAAAAHSCPAPGKAGQHGKSAAAPGHKKA
jgi:hypothetical protein